MTKPIYPNPERVFYYFHQLCAIPHGSGNMTAIADYCMAFAEKHSLRAVRDDADNVVIYKAACEGYEHCEPLILQGHFDMVCQKEDGVEMDFERDPIPMYIDVDKDEVSANGTSLGADNGIAVAMILSILESDTVKHPPIEAVFTTDEEIGMVGAWKLDTSLLCGKRMINLDAEEDDTVTVSCAGGSDVRLTVSVEREEMVGTAVSITIKGLKGGHSGVEIHKGRLNADVLAGRMLRHLSLSHSFGLIAVDGGDKGNAIPNECRVSVCVKPAQTEAFCRDVEEWTATVKRETAAREPRLTIVCQSAQEGVCRVLTPSLQTAFIAALVNAPCGVLQMSAELDDLVETSANLGILKTEEHRIVLHFTLRSNKLSALAALEERMTAYASYLPCETETFGHYPPWEYKEDSPIRQLYVDCYTDIHGQPPKVEAIHAGLECAVFSAAIDGLDCIAMGPEMQDVHTTNERLSIRSTEQTYRLLLNILEKCR